MSRHSTIFGFRRPVGDHHILANVCPGFCLCPGPRHAQRSPSAETANQFALESASTLNIECLVNGFVGDAHGLVIREVGP